MTRRGRTHNYDELIHFLFWIIEKASCNFSNKCVHASSERIKLLVLCHGIASSHFNSSIYSLIIRYIAVTASNVRVSGECHHFEHILYVVSLFCVFVAFFVSWFGLFTPNVMSTRFDISCWNQIKSWSKFAFLANFVAVHWQQVVWKSYLLRKKIRLRH